MRAYKYEVIDILPSGAVSVATFAAMNNICVSYVYMKYKRGKANYNIVCYSGVNFVVVNG